MRNPDRFQARIPRAETLMRLLYHHDLDANAICTFLMLLNVTHEGELKNALCPTNEEFAKFLNVSLSTARRALKRLENAHLISTKVIALPLDIGATRRARVVTLYPGRLYAEPTLEELNEEEDIIEEHLRKCQKKK